MTPTPPSTTSSQSGHSPDTNFRVVRKRNRIPLSCAPCRHRKLKCNRQSPCDNCTKRGDIPSCTYAAPAARKKGSQSHSAGNATPDDMQNRIDRLEGLVLSLMSAGPQSTSSGSLSQALSGEIMTGGSMGRNIDPDLDGSLMEEDDEDGIADESETDKVTKSFGIMKVDAEKQKTFYLGEAHWAALLNEIGEVKNYFHMHKKEYEAQMEKVAQTRKDAGQDVGAGPALLFGASIPPSRPEILSQMPSRYMCDILIGRYFNTFDPATHILHGPTFQKQYNAHWADTSKSSIVWIAMLFAMMRLAMLSYSREGDEPPEFRGKCKDLANTFRTQMAHCLITADYTKPHNFIIETLIFHLHAEYTCNRDAEASVWVLVGMIARLAMRMGYHRDSKLFPNITPFQGEMRRRVWSFVRQADLLFSFQVALPAMIRIGDSDTELPRNIYDDEFNEDSPSLPPARPENEATSISYMIHKSRLSFGFGRVLEEINGLQPKRYEEILKIDRGLRDIYESIPEHLRLRPMSEQSLAPITLIMARFNLATVYHKAQLVLHRRFMRVAKTNSRYAHSRRTCIESAMQLLSYQAIQFAEGGDRGRMKSLRNYVNSLATHDFLLAATVLCMDLYHFRDRGDFDANTPSTSVSAGSGSQSQRSSSVDGVYIPGLNYRRDDLIHTLEKSRDIWISQRDVSMEAYKASELLNVLIGSLAWQAGVPATVEGPFSNIVVSSNGAVNDEQSAAMTLGMLQSGGLTPNSAAALTQQIAPPGQRGSNGMEYFNGGDQSFNNIFGAASATSPMPIGMFGAVDNFSTGMNLDWEAWDQYMQPANLPLDPAANLWSSNSPSSNLLTNTSSPESASNNSNERSFGHFGAFQTQEMGGLVGGGTEPTFSANSPNINVSDNESRAGEVFMGMETPQPGGMPSWKWTVMNDRPK